MANKVKPTIVLVPGAWHTPTHFAHLTSLLQSHAYIVHSIHLPGVGPHSDLRPVPKDLSQDVAALRGFVTAVLEKGSDVVVVAHSWAGIVAGAALTGLGKNERAAEGKKTGVVRCAYMCAFMVGEGVSLWDCVGGKVPEWWEVQDQHAVLKDPTIFYRNPRPLSSGGLAPATPTHYIENLQPHTLSTFTSPAPSPTPARGSHSISPSTKPGPSWLHIPTSYLLCSEDKVIPSQAQEHMTKSAKEEGGVVDVVRVRTGHAPFLTAPDVVVGWVRGVCGEDLRREMEGCVYA